jgi:hypothetical protein
VTLRLERGLGPEVESELERLLSAGDFEAGSAELLHVLPPPAPVVRGRVGALVWLQARFALEALDYWVLVAAAAPGVSTRGAALYAARAGAGGQPHLTLGLLEALLGAAGVSAGEIARALLPGGRLVDCGLIVVQRNPQTQGVGAIGVTRRVLDFLLRPSMGIDPLLAGYATFGPRAPNPTVLVVSQNLREAAQAAATALTGGGATRVLLTGPEGCGKRTWAALLAGALGRGTLVVHVDRLPRGRFPDALSSLLREARLLGAVPVLAGCEPLIGPPEISEDGHDHHRERRDALLERLRIHPDPVLLVAERQDLRAAQLEAQMGLPIRHLQLAVPNSAARQALWDRYLPEAFRAPQLDLDAAIAKYALTPGKIERVADTAVARAMEVRGDSQVDGPTLDRAVREHVNPRLSALARHVEADATWSDLIVSEEHLILLQTLVQHYRHRRLVHETWGIGRTTRNRGVCALMSGPPGTGKTLAANVIAHELGMELFQVDLSSVASKYIGETEKALALIFEEAEATGALILFDEADSLFGRRTEVRTSTDRYANMGTNYLLQRLEAFEGMVILTTNLLSAIDEAFLRRIQFNIVLSAPDAEMREKLWQLLIPEQLPLSDNVDYGKLSREFDMTGGLIRNAVVQAAFFAAELECEVDHDLLWFAATLEMRSQGQLVRSVDVQELFADYRARRS